MRSLNSPIGELYFPNQQQRREDGYYLNGERHELDDPIFGKDWYGPDLITEWGLKFIDEAIAAKKPFFYYLPHCADPLPAASAEGRYRPLPRQVQSRLGQAPRSPPQAADRNGPRRCRSGR